MPSPSHRRDASSGLCGFRCRAKQLLSLSLLLFPSFSPFASSITLCSPRSLFGCLLPFPPLSLLPQAFLCPEKLSFLSHLGLLLILAFLSSSHASLRPSDPPSILLFRHGGDMRAAEEGRRNEDATSPSTPHRRGPPVPRTPTFPPLLRPDARESRRAPRRLEPVRARGRDPGGSTGLLPRGTVHISREDPGGSMGLPLRCADGLPLLPVPAAPLYPTQKLST